MTGPVRSGRQAQAARNDTAILDAARRVFMSDPSAPIAAVAKEAGVGISALYHRYAGKEQLLQRLCADGLRTFIAVARAADRDGEPWDVFADFVGGIIDADVHSLTVHLAGRFVPTPELGELSGTAIGLATAHFDRAMAAGALRPDLDIGDLTMLFEQVTAVRVRDAGRTRTLRRRYLALQLDGWRRTGGPSELAGPPPTDAELGERWVTGED
jgi:AcrR family transcriptional regulator